MSTRKEWVLVTILLLVDGIIFNVIANYLPLPLFIVVALLIELMSVSGLYIVEKIHKKRSEAYNETR